MRKRYVYEKEHNGMVSASIKWQWAFWYRIRDIDVLQTLFYTVYIYGILPAAISLFMLLLKPRNWGSRLIDQLHVACKIDTESHILYSNLL